MHLEYLWSFPTVVYAEMLIALDPGHGGKRAGAQNGDLREGFDIALDIAQRMKRKLVQNDFTVMMTQKKIQLLVC